MKWEVLLQKVQCHIKKADIISLPNLSLDKTLVARCIDILKKCLKRLKIENIAIFKKDFLTIYNIIRVTY